MTQIAKKFYVTTPIYYVTAKPHLGSLYSTLLADIAARWNKLQGKEVFFLTGTDEHGQKVAQAAEKAGMQPQQFVDSFIDAFKDTWHKFEIDYSYFIRTTDTHHVKAVQQWLRMLREKGDIYKGAYHGWYCTSCETFVLEKDLAGADQAPLCPSCGRTTTMVSEEAYFFRLTAYQDRLLAFYEQHPDFIIPKERANEVINFVKAGLKDLSISRTTVQWGVPFPDDSAHVTYVWADALNNYITGIGYGQPGKQEEFKKWWPADLQILGKDILRFHAIYWPAFLMASGLPLPKCLLVHGWIKVDDKKMSKSWGNVIDPQKLYETYGPDPVRYYLARQIAITHDSDFSIEDLEQKIGSDLADDLGNLLNRMITLAHKYDLFDILPPQIWTPQALALRDECWNMVQDVTQSMDECMYHMALSRVWKFINQTNAYFHAQEPWKMAKHDQEAFKQVLSATAHSLRAIALILWPVMPTTMIQLLESIGCTLNPHADTLTALSLSTWHHEFMFKKIPVLFNKPEVKPLPDQTQAEAVPEQSYITIDDLAKVELLVGTIEQAEAVPNSDKLLKLQVNFGDKGMRQILSGIKKSYAPESLVGKQAVFVGNLKPRTMMGLESNGMLMTAQAADGLIKIITVAEMVPNGTQLR